jgi:hypothetical protein
VRNVDPVNSNDISNFIVIIVGSTQFWYNGQIVFVRVNFNPFVYVMVTIFFVFQISLT